MALAHQRVFVSHATPNAAAADRLVERLRDHYITTWFAIRQMEAGYFETNIREALGQCDWFIVMLSPAAVQSSWVRLEVELAMKDPRLDGRIIPILVEACDWRSLHPNLERYQLFDFVASRPEYEARLLRTLGVEPHTFPPVVVGDVKMPVHIFVGGDGVTRFRPGDIVCDGPGLASDESRAFEPPDDVRAFATEYLPRRQAECAAQGQVFVNNRQVRLAGVTPGMDNRSLRLTLGWTWYYHTAVTNAKTDERLPDGRTIGQKYAAPIDNLHDDRLSNPIAVNLSVVTADNYIFFGQRSSKVATLAGGFQPAVSGDGQPEDVDENGVYDPFRTAVREAIEECVGPVIPAPTPADVTFFGLGRWMKTRYPFLFGDLRLPGVTAKRLESYEPTKRWEGARLKLPFTVEGVTEWVAARYRDQYFGRSKAAVSSPIFSLLQSLRYAYPERWLEVIDRLDLPDIPPPTTSAAFGDRGPPTSQGVSVADMGRIEPPQSLAPTVAIQLTIDRDFDTFSPDDASRLLKEIQRLLTTSGKITIIKKARGSTLLLLELTIQQAEELMWVCDRRLLESQGVTNATAIAASIVNAVIREKERASRYDVFLCHNSHDKLAVARIALRLRAIGIHPWLDENELRPGLSTMTALEEQIEKTNAAAVFVGKSGVGPWQRKEIEAILEGFVRRSCRVIPVFLRSRKRKRPELPLFLRTVPSVDFNKRSPDPFGQLVYGITGRRTGSRDQYPHSHSADLR